MNTFTRVVAWIHVVAFAAALFLLSTVLGGGTAVTETLTGAVAKIWPRGTSLIPPASGFTGGGIALLLGYVLIGFLLWVFLLRKQAWAWWGLMILLAAGVANMIVSRFPTDYAWVNTSLDRFPRATLGYSHLIAGVALLINHPWNWRGRRSGTRRRRKSRDYTSSSSSRTRSRRRRSRRR